MATTRSLSKSMARPQPLLTAVELHHTALRVLHQRLSGVECNLLGLFNPPTQHQLRGLALPDS